MVKQIFALNYTSVAVCKDNRIIMWGSNKEGFMTTNEGANKEAKDVFAKEFTKIEKLTSVIGNELLKQDGTFTEVFINCK